MIQINKLGMAVITGAAGGFGSCFARRLAERGHNLLLIDRRDKELRELCDSIEKDYGVTAESLVVDLTNMDQVADLAEQLEGREGIEYLINNAGFAHRRDFSDISVDRHCDMVYLHVNTPMQLTRAVLPGMIERNCGNIINLSSLGAWLAAGDVQYAATKTYLIVLSQELQEELWDTNIRVQALCPSFVDTGFHNTTEMTSFPRHSIPKRLWMTSDAVIDCSLKSLEHRNRPIVVPGWRNKIMCAALRARITQPIIRWFERRNKKKLQPDVQRREIELNESTSRDDSKARSR